MRIAIYSSPIHSISKPTGVGRHIASMMLELARADGVEPVLLTSRGSYEKVLPYLTETLKAIPVCTLPGPERLMRAMLLGTRLAGAERWCGDVDWVYSPKEQPIATRRTRLAVTVHDVLPFEEEVAGLPATAKWSRARWRMTMKRIVRRAHVVATVSQFTKQRLLALADGIDERRIKVIGNGVAPVFFREAAEADANVLDAYSVQPGRYLVTVGSLTHRKNGLALIRLAQRFHERGTPMTLLIAGRRHDQDLVEQLAQISAGKRDFPLRLLGYVPDADLAALLSHASAMLFPSRYEGFGIPALEAMAAGTPVIGSRAGALPEVIGDAGLQVSGDDDQELATVIDRLENDGALRADLIERGRERAAGFTWSQCAQRLIAALRDSD